MPRYSDPPIAFEEARGQVARALARLRPVDFDAAWRGGPPALYPSPDGRKWDIFLGWLWSKDGAGAAAAREALGDAFGVELTDRLEDFRLPPDGIALLRAAGERRDLEVAAYTMADVDGLVEASRTGHCVLLTPSTYTTVTNVTVLADMYASGGVVEGRPVSFFSAMLRYEIVPENANEAGYVAKYLTPFTSLSALAPLKQT
jgi:hypothetical protein